MPGQGFNASAAMLDLSPRVVASTVVVASPALAAETIIGSITLPSGLSYASGIAVFAWYGVTVGTAGVSLQTRVRRTSVAGTLIQDSGAVTAVAADLRAQGIIAFDTAPADGQVYKLTLQVASGGAISTVSALTIVAVAV